MKPPVRRIVVFGGAVFAETKVRHRRERPIVGDAFDDGEPRPAVGAIDEGVQVTPVGGIEQFAQAIRASETSGEMGMKSPGWRSKMTISKVVKPFGR